MASQAFLAHGATLSFNSTDVGGVVSISLPDQSRGDVEVTDNDSSGTRRYIPGLRDGGSVSVTCRFLGDDSGQEAVRTNYAASRSVVPVTITLPADATTDSTQTTVSFDGYINAIGGDLPQDADDAGSFTFTIKVDGDVTVATA